MKLCRICGKRRRSTSFNKSKATKDGLQTRCRECEKVYRLKNRKNILKRHAKYNAKVREKKKLLNGLACKELDKSINRSCKST